MKHGMKNRKNDRQYTVTLSNQKTGAQLTKIGYTVTETGTVIDMIQHGEVHHRHRHVTWVLIGFTNSAVDELEPPDVTDLEFTIDDLFDENPRIIGTRPVMRLQNHVYAMELVVVGVDNRNYYVPRHRKEGTPA